MSSAKTNLLLVFCLLFPFLARAAFYQTDVCVYGGTSGGVIAAVAAARMGKTVSLVVVSNHVGGLTAGGLGVTDVGNAASIGGMASEFYARVGQYYGSSSPVYWFEPHVAEHVFLQMLAEVNVPIYTNEQLSSVTMSNQYITQMVTGDGTQFIAKEFIDATYEGDLMAAAGVTYTVGREGTNAYGESLAGIQVPTHSYSYSPYVIAGNTNSGLLPLVQAGSPGTVGQGDNKVQCYNFRLCLTQTVSNQIPITAPTNYAESNYALVANYIAAYVASAGSVTLPQLINIQTLIPNNKTDINADGELSTDYLGYNFSYPTNNWASRQVVYQAHKDYIAGFLYYLGHSTNVPSNVSSAMLTWGYAKDEFQDNGGWPYWLYVREARRMVSDYVMQQGNAIGGRVATDSIALASYTLDCHPVARLAYNGLCQTEGDIGTTVPTPYPISYRSIIPAVGQCKNLFCTFALSASHVGFASIRLEAPFMMLSQSAATAAAFAIDDNLPVQQVDYTKLSTELIADGQLLTWASGQSIGTNGIILTINNTVGTSKTGTWSTGSNPGGWPLPNGTYLLNSSANSGNYFRFSPTLPVTGFYDVYIWWVYANNRATNVPVDVVWLGGSNRFYFNQQVNVTNWVHVISTNFPAGTNTSLYIRNLGTTSGTYVVANAVRFVPPAGAITNSNPPPSIAIVASDAQAGEYGGNIGRFQVVSVSGSNTVPVTVNYTISGTGSNGVDYAALSGSVVIPSNTLSTSVLLTPNGNTLASNSATVTLTLAVSTNYAITNPASATVTLQDRPLSSWKRGQFSSAQLIDPNTSGDAATPANDGLPNLVKYALGLSPFVAYGEVMNPQIVNGYLTVNFPESLTATDVALRLEYSPDLLNWFGGSSYIEELNAIYQGSTASTIWQTTQTNSPAFIRMVVSPQ